MDSQFRQQQKTVYDKRHHSHPLPPIANNTEVYITPVTGQVMLPNHTLSTPQTGK